jgi:predicted HTH transcriptional regulator
MINEKQSRLEWFWLTIRDSQEYEISLEDSFERYDQTVLMMKNLNAPVNALVNAPVNASVNAPVTNYQKELLKHISSNSTATYEEMANHFQKNRSTIMRNISKLKKVGKRTCIVFDKASHWEIMQ